MSRLAFKTTCLFMVPVLAALACGDTGGSNGPTPMPTFGSIGGVVTQRTEQGDQPLPGRTVNAWIEQDHVERRLMTDAQSRYELSQLAAGSRVWLRVDGEYPWSQCALVAVAVAGPFAFDLLVAHGFSGVFTPDTPGFRSISGVVWEITASGRVPMTAFVNFALQYSAGTGSGTRTVHWTLSDGDGRFRLCGIPEATGGLVIASDGDGREARFIVPPGPSTNIEIEVR